MYVVEFQAPIENGVVYIPQEYKELHKIKNAKFLVMYDDTNKDIDVSKINKKLKAISIDTVGFKFNRDEAHER